MLNEPDPVSRVSALAVALPSIVPPAWLTSVSWPAPNWPAPEIVLSTLVSVSAAAAP
jgi:hypothetical protein